MGGSFTLHAQFAFGHGGDHPSYVSAKCSCICPVGNAGMELVALALFTENLPANRVRPQFARRTFYMGNKFVAGLGSHTATASGSVKQRISPIIQPDKAEISYRVREEKMSTTGNPAGQIKARQTIWFVFRAARQTAAFHRRFALLKCR
jgi:hypothetical protein